MFRGLSYQNNYTACQEIFMFSFSCSCRSFPTTCGALSSAEVLVHFQLLALSLATLLIGCLGSLLHLERWKARISPSRNKPQRLLSSSRPLLGSFVAQSIPFSAGVCQLALAKVKFSHPDLTSSAQVFLRNYGRETLSWHPQMSELEGS